MIRQLLLHTLLLAATVAAAGGADLVRVATLHPLLSDLARQVGGDRVEVISVLPTSADVHAFNPAPEDLKKLDKAQLVLAMGKGLESYLPKLKENLRKEQTLLEVGRTIPSLTIDTDNALFACCPDHSHGALDPHWWHSVPAMKRATRTLAKTLSSLDPDHKSTYMQRASTYGKELDELDTWVSRILAPIPRSHRKLATAHLAYSYFCRDHRFQAIPVQGLNKEQNPSPAYLKQVVRTLTTNKVPAIFPEHDANPKLIATIAKDTGVRIGPALLADNLSEEISTYPRFIRHNVQAIAKTLTSTD